MTDFDIFYNSSSVILLTKINDLGLSNSCLEEMCQEYARNIGNTEVLCKKDRMVLVLLPSGHEEVLTSSKHGRYRNPKKFVLLGS